VLWAPCASFRSPLSPRETTPIQAKHKHKPSFSYNQVRIWNASTGVCVRILRGHTSMVRSLAVMPDGNRVISAGTDGTLRLWDIETGQNLAVVGGRLGHVLSLVALPDGRCVVSGDFDRVSYRGSAGRGGVGCVILLMRPCDL